MTDCFIYDAVRTPRGKGKMKDGALADATPEQAATHFAVHHTLHVGELRRVCFSAYITHAAACRHRVIDTNRPGQESARIARVVVWSAADGEGLAIRVRQF